MLVLLCLKFGDNLRLILLKKDIVTNSIYHDYFLIFLQAIIRFSRLVLGGILADIFVSIVISSLENPLERRRWVICALERSIANGVKRAL